MGRPLNKRYFGEGDGVAEKFRVRFHNGTEGVVGYIVRQRGSKRFLCSDGTESRVCSLVNKPIDSLAAGEMTLSVLDDDENLFRVMKITAKKLTTNTGFTTPWNWTDLRNNSYVEMERAEEDEFVEDGFVGPIGATNSTFEVTSPHDATGLDGATITVTVIDVNGLPVTGLEDGDFVLAMSGDLTKGDPFAETASGSGIYETDVTSETAGEYEIAVTVDGVAITQTATVEFEAA